MKAHEAAHVHIDTSFLPSDFIYDEHYRFAIFVQPSRCTVELCSSSRVRLSPEEFLPCKKPREFSNWFQSTQIPKNVKNNITVYALDDVIFKLEIHLLHGLYIPYAPLFENTTVVRIASPSRAKSIVGNEVVETRKLSKYVSFTEETIAMVCHLLTHSLSHSLTHSYSLTHLLTHSLTHSLLLTHSLTHLLTHSLTHSLTLTHSLLLTHSLTYSL